MLIGSARAELAVASAALCCAGARIVASRPDLALIVDAKAVARRPRANGVPTIAIVPRVKKPVVLAAGIDAAYSRPVGWKAYRRLVERVLIEWTAARHASSRR